MRREHGAANQPPAPEAVSWDRLGRNVRGLLGLELADRAEDRGEIVALNRVTIVRDARSASLPSIMTPCESYWLGTSTFLTPSSSCDFWISSALRGMMISWLTTESMLTITEQKMHRPDGPMRADAGGQHRQELVVLLHPGDGEDRRHHADHAAEPVEIRSLWTR